MPISEKIQKEIHNLKLTEDEKKLMMDILAIEDRGSRQYTEAYKKLIKDYLDKHNQGDDKK